MRAVTMQTIMTMVKGVETHKVIGQWFDDQLVVKFFDEIDWEEIDGTTTFTTI